MSLIIINRTNKTFIIILSTIFVHFFFKSLQIITILKILIVGENKSICLENIRSVINNNVFKRF